MSQRYDATTKFLVENQGAAWLRFCTAWLRFCTADLSAKVEAVPTDLATVSAMADTVLRVRGKSTWLLHIELQSSRDTTIIYRSLMYNSLLLVRHKLSVQTLIVLLRRSADFADLNGQFLALLDQQEYFRFDYKVLRVWELPLATFLDGALGLVPLAPLTDEAAPRLEQVMVAMRERFERDAEPQIAKELWTATDVLMGLRYEQTMVDQLLREVSGMRESVTYQAILEEGKREGILEGKQAGILEGKQEGQLESARQMLLTFGSQRFGQPDGSIVARLERIKKLERLQRMAESILTVSSWAELLAIK